jgi:hypothetical protein
LNSLIPSATDISRMRRPNSNLNSGLRGGPATSRPSYFVWTLPSPVDMRLRNSSCARSGLAVAGSLSCRRIRYRRSSQKPATLAARAGGKSGQHRGDRPSGAADRKDTLAEHSGRLPGDGLRASRRHAQRGLWTTPGGSFRWRRNSAGATNQAVKSGGKDGGYATFENAARFPLFHRSGDDGVSLLIWKADTSRATKTGHLHVLTNL